MKENRKLKLFSIVLLRKHDSCVSKRKKEDYVTKQRMDKVKKQEINVKDTCPVGEKKQREIC